MPGSRLSVNNLGGVGPDQGVAQEFRLSGVGNMNGMVLDLVITVAPGSDYRPNLRVRNNNGMNCANLGQGNHGTGHEICTHGANSAQINLGSGIRGARLGEETTLNFDFRFAATDQAAEVPGFYITFLDIDQNRQGRVREKLYVRGFQRGLLEVDTDVQEESGHDGGWTSFKSMQTGQGCDNPVDPMHLATACGVDQRKRAVTLTYERTSSFQVRFETVCGQHCREGGESDGRNFLFSFKSSLADLCQ